MPGLDAAGAMGWSPVMVAGMAAIVVGAGLVVWALWPRARADQGGGAAWRASFAALDSTPLRPSHVLMILALTTAIAVDSQKPFTFAFILPDVARDYALSSPQHPTGALSVALLPFSGILGTMIGSLGWGHLGDRIGRRPAILLSAVSFVATSACGGMPSFTWNIVMCFLMGLGVGGLLPLAFTLLTETVPQRWRGQAVVLVAGIGTALGFLVASWLSHWLIPGLGWRSIWFTGLPTGLLLIALSRAIPESPRYLLAEGRDAEAAGVMRRFGVHAVTDGTAGVAAAAVEGPARFRDLSPRLRSISAALFVYGLAWGLVNFGFIVWLPLDLGDSVGGAAVTGVLARAALFALPGSLLVMVAYTAWSAKGTMVLAALLTVVALGIFAGFGDGIVDHGEAPFTAAMVLLLVSMWAVLAVLGPYSSEIYPTAMRGSGAGWAAAATKLGGVIALGFTVLGVTPPGVRGAALVAAVPMALGGLLLLVRGLETRNRGLEEITERLAVRA